MKQRTSQTIYRYWNEVRGTRMAPTRLEIEPGRITEILSESFILESGPDQSFVFRLAGTRICDQYGIEMRGASFLSLAGAEHIDVLEEKLHAVITQGAVGVFEFEASADDGRTVVFEAVVLPLLHSGQAVSRFLGTITAIDPPVWLGTKPLTPSGLLRAEVQWPDGRPHAVIERGRKQSPFIPGFTAARIVRHQRRQFRVFEGGRDVRGKPLR